MTTRRTDNVAKYLRIETEASASKTSMHIQKNRRNGNSTTEQVFNRIKAMFFRGRNGRTSSHSEPPPMPAQSAEMPNGHRIN